MKILKKIRNKQFWEKGSGELLGFAIVVPFSVLLICFIISAFQVAVVNQKLSYAAYNCGRAAVVSETQELGAERAKEVYELILNSTDDGYVPCEIELLDGEHWEKGAYIKCTVRVYVDVMMPFTSGIREQSVVMMIENG